ncbi:response regulator [Azohydromonas lata]|uniref:Two-component system response regulator n=1 Tax=Azohydromonas lata TaxID=45677 RepID=A0ABU5IEL7_9BURK|nr:two-component system response regulator [Azohydromonas lata]MDZ5457573.1 two-component system response regulator [Azohydromonas lata]
MTQQERPTILVVDDTPDNLTLLADLLGGECRVKLANGGARALALAQREPPDLVLLDVMMPGMDGFEVCRQLKAHEATRDVPVIFLTALGQAEDETRGFELGAVDFITKPISPPVVQARVKTQLQVKAWRDSLSRRNAGLQAQLLERMNQVERLRDATLHVMVSLAEFRDEDTGNHIKRTQEYVRVLAEYVRAHPEGCEEATGLDDHAIELMAKSAPLHDIGKIAIPDHILLKPGKLDAAEFEQMKGHSVHGWEILRRAAQRMAGDSDVLLYAMQIARHHHERWDGGGYPDRLAGRGIPLAARLMAVADVYDALTTRRPYKEPFPHARAMAIILDGRGSHFDPQLIDALLACEPRFVEIASTWRD